MNPCSTNFHLLIVICLNEIVVVINGGSKIEAVLEPPSINLDASADQTQKLSIPRMQSDPRLISILPTNAERHTDGHKPEKPFILITPKTWMAEPYLILQHYNIDFKAYKVLNIVNIVHCSVIIECLSTNEVTELQKAISEPGELNVQRMNFRGHVASVGDLPEQITQDEMMNMIAAKYHHSPRRVRFVPYAPGWRGDFKVALIDVNSALLEEIRASPQIPIRWKEYTIEILLQTDKSVEDAEIVDNALAEAVHNYSQLYPEILDETKPPLKITQISKLSVTEAATKTCASNDDHGPSIPRRDSTNKHSSVIIAQKEEIRERVRGSIRETLARILPLTQQSLFKIVDKSINKTLKVVLPLLKMYELNPNKAEL